LIGWALWFLILVFLTIRIRDRELRIDRRTLVWLAVLSVLILIFTPFFGLLPSFDNPGKLDTLPAQHLMFFAAVPWMMACGILGTLPGVLLGGISGLLLAYLDTHQIFTPLIFMTLALVFGGFVNQRYRTGVFRFLSFPLIAVLTALFVALPMIFLSMLLTASGPLALRVVTAIEYLPLVLFPLGGMLLVGGVICSLVNVFSRKTWGLEVPLQPAPGELSLRFRLLATTVPILLFLLVALGAGLWITNEKRVRRELVEQLTQTAGLVAEQLPDFLQSGQALILDLANNTEIRMATPEEAAALLDREVKIFPFFKQLFLLETSGKIIARTPGGAQDGLRLTPEERSAFEGLLGGTEPSAVPGFLDDESQSPHLSFFAVINDGTDAISRILMGRAALADNPLTISAINLLHAHENSGGIAYLVDSHDTLLYHTNPDQVLQNYTGPAFNTSTYFEEVSADGQEMVQFHKPIPEIGWALVMGFPLETIHLSAWQGTYPVMLFGLGSMIIVILVVLIGLSPLIRMINQMKTAFTAVSNGNYDVQFPAKSALGEMGQLVEIFLGMVGTHRNRILKQTDLLTTSKSITNRLTLSDSLEVIMKAALAQGVSSVRIVLLDSYGEKSPETPAYRFGLGKYSQLFAPFDNEILAQARTEGSFIVQDFQPNKGYSHQGQMPYAACLVAMLLKWENDWLGVQYVTFQDHRTPDTEEIEFFKALSERTAVAVVTARTLDEANAVRRRMETVLDVLPDAVLITDGDGLVVYHNKIARSLFGNGEKSLNQTPVASLIAEEDQDVFQKAEKQNEGIREIQFKDGSVYQVIHCPVQPANPSLGQAIVLKDITQYKESDFLKTEFVTTVSHELRSPLTLIHGYAKILRLTGNLNEQQDATVGKIIAGIEEMRHLVQNLLDIGRLEAGKSLDINWINVTDFAQKIIESMEAQARQKNIQMTLTLPETPVTIEGDSIFLTQAVKNLLENAIKYTKMGGEVSLKVQSEDDKVVFVVQDNGIGIAPLDQRHLFEKFHRTGALVGRENIGSGLGLAIVRSVAERHGGRVWVESQLGKGSTFYLQIPRR